MAVIRRHSYKVLAFILAFSMGVFWFSLVDISHGAQATSRSDTLNNSNVSATSNHTIAFTVQDNITSQGGLTASSNFSITFPSDFNLSTHTCNDLDLSVAGTATSLNVAGGDGRINCPNTSTSWGVNIDSANRLILFTSPTSIAQWTWVATGTKITVSIGSNATFQGTGSHRITNTSTGGTKTITVGGSFGGTGNILVAINASVQISATIAETLTFAINGLPGYRFSGTDRMAGCIGKNGVADEEDTLALNSLVTTTAITVPFGTILTDNSVYQACQRLEIQTNSGNGYTITSRENHPLQTAGGFVIDDMTGDAGIATPTTTDNFFASYGLGISCVDSTTSVTCSTANPDWSGGGPKWAPISANSKGLSPAKLSGLTSATGALVLIKVKYRLVAPVTTNAGTYTNLVSFIATPVY